MALTQYNRNKQTAIQAQLKSKLCEYGLTNNYERKHLQLLEYRGVAGHNIITNIEIALSFIMSQLNNLNKDITFDLNNIENYDKIKLADIINITIKKDNNISAMYINDETKIVNGRVKKIVFYFYINPEYKDDPQLKPLLRRLLYHEFTHCIEDINRKLKNNDDIITVYMSDNSKFNYDKITDFLKNTKNQIYENEYDLCNLLYRLYIDTELNANANELYGDLLSIRNDGNNINRTNIKNIIFNYTEAGQDYLYFKDIINSYKNINKWIPYAKKYCNTVLLNKFKNNNDFHKWFISYGENQLRKYFNYICKISETFLLTELNDFTNIDALADTLEKQLNKTCNEHVHHGINVYNTFIVKYKKFGDYNLYETTVYVNKIIYDLL